MYVCIYVYMYVYIHTHTHTHTHTYIGSVSPDKSEEVGAQVLKGMSEMVTLEIE